MQQRPSSQPGMQSNVSTGRTSRMRTSLTLPCHLDMLANCQLRCVAGQLRCVAGQLRRVAVLLRRYAGQLRCVAGHKF